MLIPHRVQIAIYRCRAPGDYVKAPNFRWSRSVHAAATRAAAAACDGGLLRRLAFKHGVQLDPAIGFAQTPHGLGVVARRALEPSPASPIKGSAAADAAAAAGAGRALVRVPLGIVLSASLPGCCPAARAAPELRPLLADPAARWELQLAGLLLWACAPGTAAGCVERRFWREYRSALPPAERQASLLLFGEDELAELQVGASS